jgi:hypothetical protein
VLGIGCSGAEENPVMRFVTSCSERFYTVGNRYLTQTCEFREEKPSLFSHEMLDNPSYVRIGLGVPGFDPQEPCASNEWFTTPVRPNASRYSGAGMTPPSQDVVSPPALTTCSATKTALVTSRAHSGRLSAS